jgi:hypothetical protein
VAYLTDLAKQHERWLADTDLPVLRISTEVGIPIELTLSQIRAFLEEI